MGDYTEHPTTALERSVRIRTIAANANGDHLQALLELGAQRAQELNGMASGPDLDAGVMRLAADITETFEPEAPAFEREEPVSLAEGDPADARLLGRVEDRYLNEHGAWEYRVRLKGGVASVVSFGETEIAPFKG